MIMIVSSIIIFLFLNKSIDSYQIYQNQIPNGNKVPQPCNSSVTWSAVGHTDPSGGGQRNQFGIDFANNKRVWTPALCNLDSDGDGRTNGEELGDPRCVWSYNLLNPQIPERTNGITNPGVCEPWESEKCAGRQPWLKCQKASCPAMTAPGVKSIALRFPHTNIPAQETTYRCVTFALPNDDIYDIVATSALIDNRQAVHHLVLYTCDSSVTSTDNQPFDCPMGGKQGCTGNLVIWSKGFGDNCLPKEYGFRIGTSKNKDQTGTRFVVLQIHWTNYPKDANMFDSSGLTIYYTPALRPDRADVLQIVQNSLFIPPKLDKYEDRVVCSSYCTNSSLKAPVTITQGHVHMHLLGKYGSVVQKRNGVYLRHIVNEHVYDYNSPEMITLPTPVELRPGDEIVVNCVFDSSSRNRSTRFGPATLDEMCIGFLVYYPAQQDKFQDCGESFRAPYCQHEVVPVSGCNYASISATVDSLSRSCNTYECTAECARLVRDIENSGCLATQAGYNYVAQMAIRNMDYIDVCIIAKLNGCQLAEVNRTINRMKLQCDYTCNDECRALNRYAKSTGCIQVPLQRHLNRSNPDLAYTFASCDKLDQAEIPAAAGSSINVSAAAAAAVALFWLAVSAFE